MRTNVIPLDQIKKQIASCADEDLIQLIEDGFVEYSKGNVLVPSVGHLPFSNPPGDLHIKYGYIKNDDFYVIKIASGFYENPKIGLSSSNGLMLVFNQKTGELQSILLDEGYLTDIRTALAGAVVAKYLAPEKVTAIGIVGTGIQARLQLRYLKSVIPCKEVVVWGRSDDSLEKFAKDPVLESFHITTAHTIADLTHQCNYIVTTTPSQKPLLFSGDIKKGTHITAVGADTPGKQEIDAALFSKANLIVADSISQCIDHGDVSHAIANQLIQKESIIELGALISTHKKRTSDSEITIADLTGVAIQDIQIAKFVHRSISLEK